ncbi:major capsid protein [uncultured Tyzzerella sp.]|uniref:major capsid protein n=1 Tax=uncultured Tyzzerella sp. TaxID=2321398 RepID=UPI00294287B8|nr:major capsid protein [uncultured Tyzzerella sp.]
MGEFNHKSFNQVAFGKYIENLPNVKKNELIKSAVLKPNAEIKRAFSSQGGTGYAILPMYGRIGGEALNYDGKTDIVPNATKTFERGVVVVGRANAWLEDDFSEDITGGVSFMSNVAKQVNEYFDEIDQKTLLAILKGIFSMTGGKNQNFVDNHTYDISALENPKIDVTTLNTAIQKACGDNKTKFSIVIMHSVVATNLENLNLLNYLKYTDKNGIQRDLGLATLNGKIVLIDDSMPVEDDGEKKYTTYILGKGAIDFENIGAKVPYEINRDPKTNGGQDTLYARTRKCFAPFGISYTKKHQSSLSPTDAELENGGNWSLVKDVENGAFIEDKAIPIARIISKG